MTPMENTSKQSISVKTKSLLPRQMRLLHDESGRMSNQLNLPAFTMAMIAISKELVRLSEDDGSRYGADPEAPAGGETV